VPIDDEKTRGINIAMHATRVRASLHNHARDKFALCTRGDVLSMDCHPAVTKLCQGMQCLWASSWAITIFGLAGLGFPAYRRKPKFTAAAA